MTHHWKHLIKQTRYAPKCCRLGNQALELNNMLKSKIFTPLLTVLPTHFQMILNSHFTSTHPIFPNFIFHFFEPICIWNHLIKQHIIYSQHTFPSCTREIFCISKCTIGYIAHIVNHTTTQICGSTSSLYPLYKPLRTDSIWNIKNRPFWTFYIKCKTWYTKYIKTRGPWATSLTWITLANIEIFFPILKMHFISICPTWP
jgi:hypothetical protein